MTRRAVLAGTGISVPPIEVDNHMLSRILDTNDPWIQERSGIVTRYYVEPGTGSSDLGAAAAQAALDDAGMEAAEIDYIVCATMTPDHYFPGSGTLIQQKLGISPVAALDLRQQCAGFAYGMQTVDALIRSGIAQNVLLVGCDVHTSLMPFSEETWEALYDENVKLGEKDFAWNSRFRHLLVLFGDAAGAFVFRGEERDDDKGIVGSILVGDGNHKDILHVPGGGSANRPWIDAEMLLEGRQVPVMDGQSVFKLAVTNMPRITKKTLKKHGFTLDDMDLLVMHQANLRINQAAQKVLRLGDDKVFNNIRKYGNTTSATLPLCFHEAKAEGRAPEGSLIAFTALGAGLHYGTVLLRV